MHRGARVIGGERQQLGRAGHPLAPPRQLARQGPAAQPLALPHREVGVPHRRLGKRRVLAPEERRGAHPIAVIKTYGQLLAEPPFLLPALCGSAALSALFTYISSASAVFIEQHHLSPQVFVWVFAANAGASVAAAQLNRLLLKRTTPQIGLSRAQRASNMQGAFAVPDEAKPFVEGRAIVLIDDVLTSGATINAAARALLRAGAARVDVLVFARVVTGG